MKALTDSLITQYSSVSSLPWVRPAGWTDGWMDGGGEFVLSPSIRSVRGPPSVFTRSKRPGKWPKQSSAQIKRKQIIGEERRIASVHWGG